MREWLITNGIGGFASSTDKGGMNTRRYHGLLIASLNPPMQRTLLLSKVDESIEINGKKYGLYTNESNGTISTGYKYQTNFEKVLVPIYTYKVKNVIIEKSICMVYGKNAVVVMYKIVNKKNKVKLNLTPIVNFRDFHSENHSTKFNFKQKSKDDRVQIKLDNSHKLNICVMDSQYNEHENNMFYNMHYKTEEERGFDSDENHYIPGTFEIEVKPNEDKKINFVCSLDGEYGLSFEEMEKIDGDKIIKKENTRINKQVNQSKLLNQNLINENKELYDNLIEKYIIASDNFIVYRDSNKLHTLIAGYPWFLDWGRDTFIAFEGSLLITKRFDMAREALLTFASSIKDGIIPNGFSEYDGTPLYNSVDATLLFIDSVNKYLQYTRDYSFVEKNLYKSMKQIIQKYSKGTDLDNNNIYLDKKDYLLVSGTKETQNTWMDAKVNGKAVTPRNGKAVEINAMWYNALRIMEKLNKKFGGKTNPYTKLAENCKESFTEKFYNDNKKCLFDVIEIDDEHNDDKIRPNQLFALSMTYPIIDCESQIAKDIFVTVTKKLLNKYGLQTLANKEEGYSPIYEGNPIERDSIYHQGPTWPWLLGLYYDALKNLIKAEKDEYVKKEIEAELLSFRTKTAKIFMAELDNGNTIGSICELYDSKSAKRGKGAFAQAWSISEVFRIILGK